MTERRPAYPTLAVPFRKAKALEQGEFTGLASTYGSVDLGGDMIMPGAFTKTLSDHNGRIKILFGHNHWSATPIGMGDLTDTKAGLEIKGRLRLETSPLAADVYAALKDGSLDGLSIGYDAVKVMWNNETEMRELHEVKLYEVSIVCFPMNEEARVDSVKGIGDRLAEIETSIRRLTKAGRQLSSGSRGKIQSAIDQLAALLAEADADDDEAAAKAAARRAQLTGLYAQS